MSTDHDLPTDEEQHETSAESDPRAQSGESDEWERAPSDFKSEIDVEATQVPDHPVKVYPQVRGEVKEASAYLVTQGDIEEYAKEAPDDADATEFGVEAIVSLLNEKYISPDLSLTVEDYRNSPAGFWDEFFSQIVPEMGN